MQNIQSKRLLLTLLVVALSAFGCAEDDVVTTLPDWICIEREAKPGPEDDPCPSGGRFVKGACMEDRCDAGDLPNNCCPGQLCSPAGLCETPTSRVEHCESDDDCTIVGQNVSTARTFRLQAAQRHFPARGQSQRQRASVRMAALSSTVAA